MKILYFDCSSGISGNMTLGALTEIIGDENYLLNELKKLNIDGYKIEISKKIKNGITGTYVDVILDNEHTLDHHTDLHEHHHEHNHSSSHDARPPWNPPAARGCPAPGAGQPAADGRRCGCA